MLVKTTKQRPFGFRFILSIVEARYYVRGNIKTTDAWVPDHFGSSRNALLRSRGFRIILPLVEARYYTRGTTKITDATTGKNNPVDLKSFS